MNLKKAIKLLKELSWIHDIVKLPNRKKGEKRWKIHNSWGDPNIPTLNDYDILTDREVVSFARDRHRMTGTSIKKNVKKFSNKKNRAATRDAIKSENFDIIPQNKPTKTDDIWSWD